MHDTFLYYRVKKKISSSLPTCYCTIAIFIITNIIIGGVLFNSPANHQPVGSEEYMFNEGRYVRKVTTDNAHKVLQGVGDYDEDKLQQRTKTDLNTNKGNSLSTNIKTNGNMDGFNINKNIGRNSLSPKTDVLSKASYGYVLAYQLYEQQTAAARNLWGLQYWANTVSMKVVEPFFMNYGMSFEPMVAGVSHPARFSDLYDRNFWNQQSTKRKCSELVSWEDFMEHAPKKTILAVVATPKPNRRESVDDNVVKVFDDLHSNTSSQECVGNEFPSETLSYFRKERFEFVRKVCIVFANSSPMAITTFTQHILGPYHPNTVTIIFSHWKGIKSGRVNLKDVKLTNDNTVAVGLLPTKQIVEESERYLQKLRLDSRVKYDGGKYFGVMVRVEKVFIHFVRYQKYSAEKFWNYMMDCASTLKTLKEFRMYKDWGRMFTSDMGKYGSLALQRMPAGVHGKSNAKLLKTFFTAVFGEDSWTRDEFEKSFNKYLNISDPVHIAQVQRTIAAKSDCLVLVGGGSTFQQVAISFYKNFHPNTKKHCIIKHCYYGENFRED